MVKLYDRLRRVTREKGRRRTPPNPRAVMTRVFASRRRRSVTSAAIGTIALAVGLAAAGATVPPPPLGAAPAPYQLYFSFELPRTLEGMVMDKNGPTRKTYSGQFRGTFGGLPLREGNYTYAEGASAGAGGGACSLATAAGAIRRGEILMTTDGKRTTLICVGTYLGTHIEFTINTEGIPIGGVGVTASGLALTGFHSHEAYMTAVRAAAAPLPPETRSQVIAQADTNPRLVSAYEQRVSPR